MRPRLVLLVLALVCCRSVSADQRLAGGRTYVATLKTSDGAEIKFWRWTPTVPMARKVLVISELGFDHRLVEPLCAALRARGFDVATLEGREQTGKPGTRAGLDAWLIDAGRAVAAHGPKPLVVAIGVGGSVIWDLAQLDAVSGVLAINVPQRFELTNVALLQAMTTHLFNPAAWLDSKYGAVLLAGSQRADTKVLSALAKVTAPVSAELRSDIGRLYVNSRQVVVPPTLPLSLIFSSSDNLVPTESAMLRSTPKTISARRLGRMETFNRNYGHLDWLVDDDAFEEVFPSIVSTLESMP